jgi:hypothetical protein
MGFLPLVCPSQFLGQIEMREDLDLIGAPEEIRTPDPQIRSLRLPYPADRSSEIYFRTVCNAMTPLVRAA